MAFNYLQHPGSSPEVAIPCDIQPSHWSNLNTETLQRDGHVFFQGSNAFGNTMTSIVESGNIVTAVTVAVDIRSINRSETPVQGDISAVSFFKRADGVLVRIGDFSARQVDGSTQISITKHKDRTSLQSQQFQRSHSGKLSAQHSLFSNAQSANTENAPLVLTTINDLVVYCSANDKLPEDFGRTIQFEGSRSNTTTTLQENQQYAADVFDTTTELLRQARNAHAEIRGREETEAGMMGYPSPIQESATDRAYLAARELLAGVNATVTDYITNPEVTFFTPIVD